MKRVEIVVATHKKVKMPTYSSYVPLQVGASLHEDLGYQKDNLGENISAKNPFFCELTGQYWLYKNSTADFKGLVHYRRYFTLKKFAGLKSRRLKKVLNDSEIKKLVEKYDLILPKKRNYLIESLWSHYEHTLYVEPLEKIEEIIAKKYPKYLKEFRKLKTRKSAHMFNMLIARADLFDDYSKWLFDVLFELENALGDKTKGYDAFHSRFYGRISELLLDVWLNTNRKKLKIRELKVLDIEGVNWFKKGLKFISAKFGGKKYDQSF